MQSGSEESLVPGYRLDRYELLCPIASGGMASVWLARLRGKRGFEKLFAIKTIRTELITDPHFQEMFLDEARIASRIIHPNVAQILELGEQNDILYIVMEYVDGDSLAKLSRLALKRGFQMPPGIALRIVAEICAGLHAAHQLKDASGESLGVVHRDVSPQNILVTTEGSSKVIDFGLVKAKNRSAGETGQGVVKGKIRYMAPEQVSTKRGIDHRADVWAAGMVLYELLVGHVPYHTEDDLDIVKKLMGDSPLPAFDAALPPQLEKLLTKAIVKDPDGRFDSCAQMRRAIESAIHELDLPAENEHVADFLKEALPDVATKRSTTIAKAIESADSRQGTAESLEGLGPNDIALAATEVSNRDKSRADAEPPTRRNGKPDESDPDRGTTSSYSRATSTTSLREQLGEDKRRGGAGLLLAGVVVLGAGAWILWPRADSSTTTSTQPAASASASAAPVEAGPTADASEPLQAAAADAAAIPVLELESLPDATDAGVSRTGGPPPLQTTRGPLPSPASPKNDTPAPVRTYNPAWSILTNPPDAAFFPPPSPKPEEPK